MIERQADKEFKLVSKYQPTGDQPQAISELAAGIKAGKKRTDLIRGYWDRENFYDLKCDRQSQ